ncbi:MAG: amidase [Chloroflexi bacterium]|nr:amidase [Chloroflexota bacterium]
MQPYDLTATAAARAIRAGELSPVDLVQSLLDRIAATESRVQAWEHVDAEGALSAARHLEAKRRERPPADLLFGVPIGMKDVFHARGLPTTANFDPYRGKVIGEDSGVVQHLREAGAVILGKTVTVQFAWGRDPVKTRNPWNAELTPGGSSSGSGAAVGARQVPAAMGTQTGGSTLRPACYCGIVALKPTFGRISRYGLLPVSWTFDHPGIMVRSIADAALLLQALARHDPRDPFSADQQPEDFVAATREAGAPPRLGLLRDLLDRADPPVRQAAETAAERLRQAGADVREVRLPVPMDLLLAVHFVILTSEGGTVHAEQIRHFAEHYFRNLRASIEAGHVLPAAAYVQAARLRRRLRAQMVEVVGGVDGIIGPTVRTLPPRAETGTGDPSFQSIWSLFGFPNVTIPTMLSPERRPHGIQIVGHHFGERELLRIATWCERVFEPLPSPL